MSLGLVADVGGTNARFALVRMGEASPRLMSLQHFACADYPSFEATLAAYLQRVGEAPQKGVVAVAGPVTDDAVKFTNLDWQISRESLSRHGFQDIHLINDYAAQALALPLLGRRQLAALGPVATAGEGTMAVLGPGSGLGLAALVRYGQARIPLATEGGHADFAPVDRVEIEILQALTARHGRVSIEFLMCGNGLSRLHATLLDLAGQGPESLSASEISDRGLAGDRACRETLLRFAAILGSVAGSVALTLGATGGVFIAGGIAPRILPLLTVSDFRARFEAKPPMTAWLQAVPTWVITDTDSALLGAASFLDHADR